VKRRAFLLGLAAAPLFIRRAFGDASVGGVSDRRGSAAGQPSVNGARRAVGGPTLVLVVPASPAARVERGNFFGELLDKAAARDLAALALVDVICAPAAEFGFGGDPLLIFAPAAGPAVALAAQAKNAREASKQFIRRCVPLPPDAAVASLAATARARYVTKHAPRGARWGRSEACGVSYEEGPPADMVDCGMAFAPEASRRFLDFYVKA
jgi:hypothetical protein